RPEVTIDRRRVEGMRFARLRHLDDDVELRRLVVDDAEPDPIVVDARRHLEIRRRRLEQPGGMVVHEHLATLRESRQREHATDVTPRDDARRLHDALLVERADEAHLTATCQPNGGTNGSRRAWARREAGRESMNEDTGR